MPEADQDAQDSHATLTFQGPRPHAYHHCNEVPIAQSIRDVPANAQLNDFSVEHSSAVDWVTGDRFGHSEPLLGVRIIRERPQMHRTPARCLETTFGPQ